MEKASIVVENLKKSYSEKVVFSGLDLKIDHGSCYSLLGKNGVGKTTLINCMLDVIKPDSGRILINRMDYNSQSLKIKSLTGSVFENNPLIEEFTGENYLKFVGMLYKVAQEELKHRIETITDYFFPDGKDLQKNISEYSTGMKKKLGVCASVLHRPDILILDEPFSGLDPVAAQMLIQFLNSYLSSDRIIFLSSHDLAYVEKVSTHIGVLDEGALVYDGTLENFTMNGVNLLDQALLKLLKSDENNLRNIDWI
ncbi:MAG: ABC transporter ATP-binding protein [Bacteroidota bacterium]|nr:ABC transporter ATP-binding protein [Bacteroidota bacterium]MDP4192398.1 ABC transporter ATP-binding protein [Bacteroidota bacterium]MDP4196001.1 ABC transporter ATP-binding protein [Bacteroidota bacterium]